MELLFVCLGGAVIGLIVRYVLPQRHTHGSVLIPAIGTACSAIVWVALTWLGMKWDAGWIWWITIAATIVVSIAADLLIGQARKRADSARLTTLSRGAIVG